MHDICLLKQTVSGFLSNLCISTTFRKKIAESELLLKSHQLLVLDFKFKGFDWVESSERILGVL
jgi:hypothetical protein